VTKEPAVLEIDGSMGEGGGQVLRTSLALSTLTGRPFEIARIRANRRKPGLMRQHLTAVQAAARVCHAQVEGAELSSQSLRFTPGPAVPGVYECAVGTAGSATLVLQTVLPPLLAAGGPSRVVVEGGTHNPLAPPFDFLERSFLPLVNRMGARISARLERWGFFPAGGGRVVVDVEAPAGLRPIEIHERGDIRERIARARVANLPISIARRELDHVQQALGLPPSSLQAEEVGNAVGPGNVLSVELRLDSHHEVFTAFGQRGVPAEAVAADAVRQVQAYLAGGQPVGDHLADQLLIPLAMAGGGSFRTGPPSRHTLTNLEVVGRFLPVNITCREFAPRAWTIAVAPR
jgi:RNA 3'-terminal phosphate cyclase (ATP)